MTKVRIYDIARLRKLCRALLKTTGPRGNRIQSTGESHRTLAKKAGLCYEVIRLWELEVYNSTAGRLQDKIYRLLGDDIFTHGLCIPALCKRLEEEYKIHGSYRKAAAALGVSGERFYGWLRCGNIPQMNMHQKIYATYGITVFKRMTTNPPKGKMLNPAGTLKDPHTYTTKATVDWKYKGAISLINKTLNKAKKEVLLARLLRFYSPKKKQ